eukprot:356096-Chlamydomonas_euryale.AAC.10
MQHAHNLLPVAPTYTGPAAAPTYTGACSRPSQLPTPAPTTARAFGSAAASLHACPCAYVSPVENPPLPCSSTLRASFPIGHRRASGTGAPASASGTGAPKHNGGVNCCCACPLARTLCVSKGTPLLPYPILKTFRFSLRPSPLWRTALGSVRQGTLIKMHLPMPLSLPLNPGADAPEAARQGRAGTI